MLRGYNNIDVSGSVRSLLDVGTHHQEKVDNLTLKTKKKKKTL